MVASRTQATNLHKWNCGNLRNNIMYFFFFLFQESSWSYREARHGKGTTTDIGTVFKRTSHRLIS